jgi:LytS/YehU family sensor histidine kinase
MPWPSPFRLRFAAVHLVAAPAAALAWFASSSALTGLVLGGRFRGDGSDPLEFLFIGTIFYAIVVGVSHAIEGSARAARAEAVAARAQLAALRAQVHPHFLFNALHTVVQLIPIDPAQATEAAELVADLLRTTLEEQRDEVTLGDEWRFVSRYLAVERIRFGDRLILRSKMSADLLDERVPAFALQTLVENAVRHGAAPRVAPTEIVVTADGTASELTLSVRNTGDGVPEGLTMAGAGTGLARLRERLIVLYGSAARLSSGPAADGGFEAVLVVPRHRRTDR